MLIGELCQRTGMTKGAIRHYEAMGLISSTPRTAGSRTYREFGEDVIQRIEIIKNGKKFGFKLSEGREILDALISNELSIEQRKAILNKRVADIDSQLRALQAARKELINKIESI
ncbi:hypothetical protein AB833_24990 [Chromatiales bacterium (ex Bugula neritina AB1)]|nr:hypothetical protein AB833_24990 [Chromatiales bacterium (ex Bugula neritina AB1)]